MALPSWRLRPRALAAALTLAAPAVSPSHAQQLEPIRYLLRIPAPETHYIEVEATYPTSHKPVVELMMAVWTPGSYLIREFARHVEEVRGRDSSGHALRLEKSRKNRWRVHTGGAGAIIVSYRVYAHEQQARTSWTTAACWFPSFSAVRPPTTLVWPPMTSSLRSTTSAWGGTDWMPPSHGIAPATR